MDYNQVKTADFNYIYYIIIAIVWIYGAIKKNQKKTPKTPSNPYKPKTNEPTFDPSQDSIPDLLKDLFENDREEELPNYQRKTERQTPKYTPQENSISDEVLSTTTFNTNEKYQKYTGHQPLDIEETERPSKRAENYKIKKTKVNKYKKMLGTPTGMKQAIIASEILQRKF